MIDASLRQQPERFAHALTARAVVIDTLAGALGRYTRRPEHKSLAPDGSGATANTHGLLQRRPVTSGPARTLLTGKEGNKLIERFTGEVTDTSEYRNDYGTRGDAWTELILPVLQDMGAAALISHGIPHTTAYRVLATSRQPRGTKAGQMETTAIDFANHRLTEWGRGAQTHSRETLNTYLEERERRGENVRRCVWCGRPLPPSIRADAKYDSDPCRQAAKRAARKQADL